MIRWVAGGIGWSLAAFTIVGSTVLLLALWYWFIQPSWEARGLYDAANEARSRPFVESADVHLDWLDGNLLSVRLTPDATAVEAQGLWCEVLLDADGGWIEVSEGYYRVFEPPKRRQCAALDSIP